MEPTNTPVNTKDIIGSSLILVLIKYTSPTAIRPKINEVICIPTVLKDRYMAKAAPKSCS